MQMRLPCIYLHKYTYIYAVYMYIYVVWGEDTTFLTVQGGDLVQLGIGGWEGGVLYYIGGGVVWGVVL